jgi:hypothetical protein
VIVADGPAVARSANVAELDASAVSIDAAFTSVTWFRQIKNG